MFGRRSAELTSIPFCIFVRPDIREEKWEGKQSIGSEGLLVTGRWWSTRLTDRADHREELSALPASSVLPEDPADLAHQASMSRALGGGGTWEHTTANTTK